MANSFDKPRIEYAIPIDTAKELAMISNTKKSKEARKYFIEIEKKYKEQSKPKSTLELLQQQVAFAIEQEKRLDKVEQDIKRIEAKTDAQTNKTGYYSILAYCKVNNITLPVSITMDLGKKASKLSKNLGITIGKIADERWGSVGSYAEEVLDEIFLDYKK